MPRTVRMPMARHKQRGQVQRKQTTGRTNHLRTTDGSSNRRVQRVTPTSERIIRKTSVKRRQAMKVLANR